MTLLRNCIAICVAYCVALLPISCKQRPTNNSSTTQNVAEQDVNTQISNLKNKSPSEIKSLMKQVQANLIAKVTNEQIKMVNENGSFVDQKTEIDGQENVDLSKNYFVLVESDVNNAFSFKIKPNFDKLEKTNISKVTMSSFNVKILANSVEVLKSRALVPSKTLTFNIADDFDKNMNAFDVSIKDYSSQVALAVAKGDADMGLLNKIFAPVFNALFPTAYAAGGKSFSKIVSIAIGVAALVTVGLGLMVGPIKNILPGTKLNQYLLLAAVLTLAGFALADNLSSFVRANADGSQLNRALSTKIYTGPNNAVPFSQGKN